MRQSPQRPKPRSQSAFLVACGVCATEGILGVVDSRRSWDYCAVKRLSGTGFQFGTPVPCAFKCSGLGRIKSLTVTFSHPAGRWSGVSGIGWRLTIS
jgi:hypothetical protein